MLARLDDTPINPVEDALAAVREEMVRLYPQAPAARHEFMARFGLLLSRRGFVDNVKVSVSDGAPAEVLHSVLAEMRAHQSAYTHTGVAQTDGRLPGRGTPAHALAKRSDTFLKRSRACVVCGTEFEVNIRHAESHVCCSAACRSRKRRALDKQASIGRGGHAIP
jgi:hypothetical protein